MDINELPEIAQPLYLSLQENLAAENWAEVERLAQAIKSLAPNFSDANQWITSARKKTNEKKEK